MTTRIKVQLTPEGVQEAIDRLEAWKVGTLKAATSMYALLVVDDVRDTMAANAHTKSGRLKDNIAEADPVRISGSDVYRLTIDPVDPADDEHYAEDERSRPGVKNDEPFKPHNFTEENALYLEKGGAEYRWNESIKESL